MPRPSISAFWLSVKSLLQKMFLDALGFTHCRLPSSLQQILQLGNECFHILKIPINRCKPHIGDLIERPQTIHEQLANGGGYTTQFILFSGAAGQSATGALQFVSQSGQHLSLILN